jgi:hypothetical protein
MITNFGLDLTSIWKDIKTASTELVKQLPGEAKKLVERKVTEKVGQVVTPIAQKIATEKTQRVISKGNVAMYALGGTALGALVAGGGVGRRTVGGLVIGAAGTIVAFKMGLLYDQL